MAVSFIRDPRRQIWIQRRQAVRSPANGLAAPPHIYFASEGGVLRSRSLNCKQIGYVFRMARIDRFANPILLADGRVLLTVEDARRLIATLPASCDDHADWQFARDLLVKANARADAETVNLARVQLAWALKAQGLL